MRERNLEAYSNWEKNCCCVLKWGSLFLHNLLSWCYLKQNVGICFCFLKTLLNLKMKILLLNHFEAFWGSHFDQILRWVLLILPFRVLFLKVPPIKSWKYINYNENITKMIVKSWNWAQIHQIYIKLFKRFWNDNSSGLKFSSNWFQKSVIIFTL